MDIDQLTEVVERNQAYVFIRHHGQDGPLEAIVPREARALIGRIDRRWPSFVVFSVNRRSVAWFPLMRNASEEILELLFETL